MNATPPDGGPSILLAEDSPIQAALGRRALERSGYRVQVAGNGEEALRLIQTQPPDALVSDVMMPGMDGFALCRAVKADERTRTLPVILLTSLAEPIDIVRGLAAGADNYLIKPYDAQALRDKLAFLLDAAQTPDDPPEPELLFHYAGETFQIRAGRRRILILLTSSYEHLVRQNRDLLEAQHALRVSNRELDQVNLSLEHKVYERTQALSRANSELEQAVKQLYDTEEQMLQSEKLAALGTLVAGVAHELNNPLMGALNYVQHVIERPDDLRNGQWLEKAQRDIRRAASVATNMLRYAHGASPRMEAVDLPRAVTDTLEILATDLRHQGIAVSSQHPDDLPTVNASTEGLQQVVLNLLVNARDALEGAPRKVIEVTTQRAGEQVWLTVSDSGPGIPEEVRRRIFDPFFTTKPPGKGTGLGLSISTRLVRSFGGEIRCSCPEAGGTVFKIILPIWAEVTDAQQQGAEA